MPENAPVTLAVALYKARRPHTSALLNEILRKNAPCDIRVSRLAHQAPVHIQFYDAHGRTVASADMVALFDRVDLRWRAVQHRELWPVGIEAWLEQRLAVQIPKGLLAQTRLYNSL